MNGNRPDRLRRATAEELLDGVPASGHPGGDPLASMLAAAAAPPRAAERAGEDAAVTAFLAERLVPVSHSGRGQMIKSPLAKLLTMKVGAAALALSAGGVALAASTGAFSPSAAGSARGGASASVATSQGSHVSTHASVSGQHGAAGHKGAAPAAHILSAVESGKVCRELGGQVARTVAKADHTAVGVLTRTGLQNALESPELSPIVNNPVFASLVATAESKDNVADYCGLILHLAKLPVPAALVKLPVSVLSGIPASIVAQTSTKTAKKAKPEAAKASAKVGAAEKSRSKRG
jgi:hypothetical protein